MPSSSLAVRTTGDSKAPPLCLLHGFMGSRDDWQPLLDALSERAFCIAPDLPGHGDSLHRPDVDYTMPGAVAAVRRTLDMHGIDRCTLLGYSMGGRVALALAVQHPDRFRHLILESASPGIEGEAARADRRRTDAERAARIRDDLTAFLHNWYRMPLFASLQRHGLVDAMIARRAANDPQELARALEGLSSGRQPPLWKALSGLSVPTQVLVGALDPKYVALSERMAARSKTIRRTVVSNAGHTIHAEQPDAFRRHVRRALPSS